MLVLRIGVGILHGIAVWGKDSYYEEKARKEKEDFMLGDKRAQRVIWRKKVTALCSVVVKIM